MNREIKFRTWNNGFYSKEPKMSEPFIPFFNGSIFSASARFMQYTGLKDENQKEIYEGDILKTPLNENCIVFYNSTFGSFEANLKGIKLARENGETSWYGGEFSSCEIIGNIYENPELLTEIKK